MSTILVGTDGSAAARAATAVALDLAKASGDEIVFVTGTERPPTRSARVAGRRQPRLVVVGSRGWGPVDGALFGSVSSGVLRHTPCPVLVVPAMGEPDEAERAEAAATLVGKE
jgi:nucleotide-binding universal stress UspA family protein